MVAKNIWPNVARFEVEEDLVRKLAELLKETGLSEIEYQNGERRIRVAQAPAAAPVYMTGSYTAPPQTAPHAADTEPAHLPHPLEAATPSPMVGTAYLSPAPDQPTFVHEGDTISEGQTILIIEAMKVMNQIKATKGGTLRKILVENAEPVEFGQPLFLID